jgi:hypothetical protein
MTRASASEIRADTKALIRHILANSKREHIPGPELAEIARLWEDCYAVPDGADDAEAWITFRLAYTKIMGDDEARIGAFLRPETAP